MELLKDYDCQIMYHLRKANIVADALSRKSMGSLSYITEQKRKTVKELCKLFSIGLSFEVSEAQPMIAQFQVRPTLIDEIKRTQDSDPALAKLKDTVTAG